MPDGFEMLMEAHRTVAGVFSRYDEDHDEAHVREIMDELTVHAEIEERALYPELRRMVDGGDDLADEAEAEHAALKARITRVEITPPADLDDVVREMRELVEQHVQQEESVIFPEMREAGVDAEELGRRLVAAKDELPTNSQR
jgi:iron-sulfur cluster repair protein YtfE (RIC family)